MPRPKSFLLLRVLGLYNPLEAIFDPAIHVFDLSLEAKSDSLSQRKCITGRTLLPAGLLGDVKAFSVCDIMVMKYTLGHALVLLRISLFFLQAHDRLLPHDLLLFRHEHRVLVLGHVGEGQPVHTARLVLGGPGAALTARDPLCSASTAPTTDGRIPPRVVLRVARLHGAYIGTAKVVPVLDSKPGTILDR